jgi:hypothetical protein
LAAALATALCCASSSTRRLFATSASARRRASSALSRSLAALDAGYPRREATNGGQSHLDDWHLGLYSVTVKNITISLDDETYRRARIKAAELETSVSALVRGYLVDLAGGESEFERLEKLERVLRDRIVWFQAGDRLSRDELHDRGR